MYIMDLIVRLGCEQGLFPMWDKLKKKKAIIFYTVQANSEAELKEKVKQLDNIIIVRNKCEYLGDEISDGNMAKWHYTQQGHWQFYHNLWGMFPAFEPLTAECSTTIDLFPKILHDIEQWDMEHTADMNKIMEITKMRPISGSGPIVLGKGHEIGLSCGFNSFTSYYNEKVHEIIEELNLKLWRSLLERVTQWGVQWYMMGDIMSRVMVDIGAYPDKYYNFMKSIKMNLDPKCILSRGKFNFWGN
jgi:hypothetical protein